MVSRSRALILAASTLLAATIVASAAEPPQAKPAVKADPVLMAKSVGDMTTQEEEQFSNAVEATMERVCILCHPFENIIKTRRNVTDWNIQVTTMAGRGAPGTDADFATITKYLIRFYGLVHVNSATAEELTSVLGLSAKDANAVVEYRKAHGKFADLAALEKVDGIDKAKLEEQREALKFD